MTSPQWNPPSISVSAGSKLKATASDMEESNRVDCSLRQALKIRPDTYVNAGGWRRNWADKIPLGWFVDALRVLHRQLHRGEDGTAALVAAATTYAAAHPGLRLFLDAALDNYLELHQSRESLVGPLRYLGHDTEVVTNRRAGASLSAWAPLYEGTDGYREIRRLRMRRTHEELTAWTGVAAKVAAGYEGKQATAVSVVEVSLADGQDFVLLDAASQDEVQGLYEQLAQPRALKIMNGIVPIACSKCGECKAVAVCSEPIPMAGVLGQGSRGIYTRSVSASELVLYERCPARWYLEKECRLPLDDMDDPSYEARERGSAIHQWLKAAHSRGYGCMQDDLPDADGWGPDFVGSSVLDTNQYAAALPFLRQHLANCGVGDGSLIAVDEGIYGWDAPADVVVAATPDLVRQLDNNLIVREVKTTEKALPESASVARDQFDGVVYWWLSLLAGGWLSHYNCDVGIVELEILRPDDSVVYQYSTTDVDLMQIAEVRMDERVTDWHVDNTWHAKPNAGCPTCPVRRWCPDRDSFVTAVTAEQTEAPF